MTILKIKKKNIQKNDVIPNSESGTVPCNGNGEQEVPPKGNTPSGNYDLSVNSPIIHENDSSDSENNEEPTSQLDTSLGNSTEQENEDAEECSEGNTTVDEGKDREDTVNKSKKKKRLGTMGPVKNIKSKKPNKSPKTDTRVKTKKGRKEEIADNNTFAKLRSKMGNRKDDTNEDSSHGSGGQSDEDKGKLK